MSQTVYSNSMIDSARLSEENLQHKVIVAIKLLDKGIVLYSLVFSVYGNANSMPGCSVVFRKYCTSMWVSTFAYMLHELWVCTPRLSVSLQWIYNSIQSLSRV